MPKIFKYTVLLILLFWLIGTLTMKTDGIIHLFLAIGVYGALLGYTSERSWKKRLLVGNDAGQAMPSMLSMVSRLDHPITLAMPGLSDYVLVSTMPPAEPQRRPGSMRRLLAAASPAGAAPGTGLAPFSRGESLRLILLYCCAGWLLRYAKDDTFRYYGYLLHSYWKWQLQADRLTNAETNTTVAPSPGDDGHLRHYEAGERCCGAIRAWRHKTQQLDGPRTIMVHDGNNVVTYTTVVPVAVTAFENTSQYFRMAATPHRFLTCWYPDGDGTSDLAWHPDFAVLKARKSSSRMLARQRRSGWGAGPRLCME